MERRIETSHLCPKLDEAALSNFGVKIVSNYAYKGYMCNSKSSLVDNIVEEKFKEYSERDLSDSTFRVSLTELINDLQNALKIWDSL